MADIGVLSIEIESNSESAAGSLNNLAGALKRVQTAIGNGLNLSGVASQLDHLGKVVNDSISGSTFSKISELANSLKQLQKATSGRTKLDKIFDGSMMEKMSGTSAKNYDEMAEAAKRYASAVTDLSTEYTKAWQAMQSVDFVFPTGNYLGAGGRQMALGPGGVAPENMLSTQVWTGPEWKPDWTDGSEWQSGFQMMNQMQDDVIETSGIITDEFDNIVGRVGTAAQSVAEFSGAFGNFDASPLDAINTGFESIVGSASSAAQAVGEFAERLQEVHGLTVNTGWTQGNGADAFGQFRSMLDAMIRFKSAMALGSGTQVSTNVETGWTYWKDGAIEVEGTVTAATGAINSAIEGTNQLLLEAGESVENISNTAEQAAGSFRGWRIFDTNTGDFTKPLEDAVDEYKTAFRDRAGKVGAAEGLEAKSAFDEAKSSIEGVRDAASSAQGPVRELMESLRQNVNGDGMGSAASGIRDFGNAASALNNVPEQLERTSSAGRIASQALESVRDSVHSLMNAARHSTLGTMVNQFGRIARYRALRYILKEITSGIKEGFDNYTKYSDQVGNKFSKELKTVNSQFAQMKNSVGAAIAPALKAALPVLQQIISLATAAINVVNQLISLLTGGSTWSMAMAPGGSMGQAAGAMEGLQSASGDVADNMKAAADATNEAKASTKDLLADWDELNIIQSKGGGGGGGPNLEDALNKFKEMQFDEWIRQIGEAINEQFGGLLGLVEQIGAILLAWKLSTYFTGWLSKLFQLIELGAIINFTANFAATMDRVYLKSGKPGWLIADLLGTAVGGMIAGKLASQIAGTGFGYYAAGITFGFSAGATFAVARNASGSAQDNLNLLGLLKLIVGSALASAGLAAMGASVVWSTVGGVITATIAAAIKYEIDVYAETKRASEAAARESFGSAGAGGIDPQKYLDEIQKQVDEYTASHKIVITAYADVPELKSSLEGATATISALNAVLAGDGALTEADAAQFKAAWDTILDTLDKMNSKNYDTILAGLNTALANANKEIQGNILELRKSFTQLEKNVDQQIASLYNQMDAITDRIAEGTANAADIEKYQKIYKAISDSTNESMKALDRTISGGTRLDFTDSENAIESAKEYLQNVTSISKEAMDVINQSLLDSKTAVEDKKARTKAFYDAGLLDMSPEEYQKAMSLYDNLIQALEESAERDKQSVRQKIQEAYETVLNTALAGDTGTKEYWDQIMKPLIESVTEAGGEVPEAYLKALRSHLSDEFIEVPTDVSLETNIKKIEGLDPETIANRINDDIYDMLHAGGSMIELENTASSNLMLDISKHVGVTGFDILTDNLKKGYANAIRNALGVERGNEVLKYLGYDFRIDEMDIPTWFVPEVQDATPEQVSEAQEKAKETVEQSLSQTTPAVVKEPTIVEPEYKFDDAWDPKEVIPEELQEAETKVKVNVDFDDTELSSEARTIIRSIQAAIEQGYSKEEARKVWDSNLEMFGFGAFAEALPYIQQMWQEAFPDNIDTSGIEEPFENAESTADAATEGILSDADALSGLSVGGADLSALTGAFASAAASVWSSVNSILAAYRTLGNSGGIGGGLTGNIRMGNLTTQGSRPLMQFAAGGFPDSGSIFMADENGDIELKGKMGNQPVVANNQQIIAGISQGVVHAQSEQNSLLRRQNELLAALLNKQTTAEVRPTSSLGRAAVRSNRMYGRVTGE